MAGGEEISWGVLGRAHSGVAAGALWLRYPGASGTRPHLAPSPPHDGLLLGGVVRARPVVALGHGSPVVGGQQHGFGAARGARVELLQLAGPASNIDLGQLSGTPVRHLILSLVDVDSMSRLQDIVGLESLTLAHGDFGRLPLWNT